MKLIIGLGNPGADYERTRHNAGWMVADKIATQADATWTDDTKRHASVAKFSAAGGSVLLAQPTTFMNESGSAVQALLSYYKVAPEDLLVIHDDMDLPLGRVSFLKTGGSAGHNGVADIQRALGTPSVQRLRIGIGRPADRVLTEDWVLTKPTGADASAFADATERAAKAAQTWIKKGIDAAMNEWNRDPQS